MLSQAPNIQSLLFAFIPALTWSTIVIQACLAYRNKRSALYKDVCSSNDKTNVEANIIESEVIPELAKLIQKAVDEQNKRSPGSISYEEILNAMEYRSHLDASVKAIGKISAIDRLYKQLGGFTTLLIWILGWAHVLIVLGMAAVFAYYGTVILQNWYFLGAALIAILQVSCIGALAVVYEYRHDRLTQMLEANKGG